MRPLALHYWLGLPLLALTARRSLAPWTTLAVEMESARRHLNAQQSLSVELHFFLTHPVCCAQCRLPTGMLSQLIEDCLPGGVGRARVPLWIWAAARRTASGRRGDALVLEITCRTFALQAHSPADGENALRRRLSRHFGRRARVEARLHSPGCSVYSITVPQSFAGRALRS